MKRKDPERSDQSAELEQPAGEDFLQRWSRRKTQAREAIQQPATADPNAATASREDKPEAPPPTDADMPRVESLTENSDISGFFSPGVSDKLRRLALRKVFSLSVYNVRDGLDDYDDDFTFFEPLGDTITADMRHRQEREAEKQREREALEQQQAQAEAQTESDAEAEPGEAPTEDDGGEVQTATRPESDEQQAGAEHLKTEGKRHDA